MNFSNLSTDVASTAFGVTVCSAFSWFSPLLASDEALRKLPVLLGVFLRRIEDLRPRDLAKMSLPRAPGFSDLKLPKQCMILDVQIV